MRIAIIYPPIEKEGRLPTLGQNRQFKFTNTAESFPAPIIPAYAATMLKEDGHDIFWHDGIIERMSIDEYNKKLYSFSPDLIMLETKTPIILQHWAYVDELKKTLETKVVLVGDHVTWNPEESMLKSRTDYVITGGDYDFGMQNLCRHLSEKKELESGVWYRDNGRIKNTGPPRLVEDLDALPVIDRDLTGSGYHEAYLYRPTGYLMSGRGCGGGLQGVGCCSFCIWQHALWRLKARLRSPSHVAEEIRQMVDRYHFTEVFDDNESGAVYNVKWLAEFKKELQSRKLIGEVMISSNARSDNFTDETCVLLKAMGYRLLKVGLESGSNETLRRLSKKETIDQIARGIMNAKDHGLRVKMTTMTGFPWESEGDVNKTYSIARKLMLYKTHFGDCLQSSVVIPYPGTPLYNESLANNWFVVNQTDYSQYDMSKPMLKCSYDPMWWCEKIWKIHSEPQFMMKSALSLRSVQDIKLAFIGARSLRGHVEDQRWTEEDGVSNKAL